jgi:Flp pilus assembly protein TadD
LLRTGDAAKSLVAMDQVLCHDPIAHQSHCEIRGTALMMLGQYEDAVSMLGRVPKLFWYIHAYLAICLARLDRLAEARAEIAKLLLLKPEMTIGRCDLADDFQRQEDRDFFNEGLRLAGMPE